MTSRARALCFTAAALALAAPFGAEAQTTATNNVQEVVVTAQRRAGRLQDVPLSVTALSSQDLLAAGIQNTRDLAIVTPGLRMSQGGIYMQPSIRGVTTTIQYPTTEANIATYIDGVYQANIQGAVFQLPDVQQIEVLKGPQGTLFGRNATGGAILVNTIEPDLARPTGTVTARFGSYDTRTFKGYVTAPLVEERLAVGLAGFWEKTDGWQFNLLRGRSHKPSQITTGTVRGKIRVRPVDGVDFTLSGFYSKMNDHSGLKQTDYGGRNSLGAFGVPISSRPYEFAMGSDNRVKPKQKSVSLRGTIDAGPGALTTITAFNKSTTDLWVDADGTSLSFGEIFYHSYFKTFSQELLYNTNQLGPVRATLGAFYFRSRGGLSPLIFPGINLFTSEHDKSSAVFGELTYDITDQLSLTGGLRYSHEKRGAFFASNPAAPVNPGFLTVGRHSWNSVTPRVSLLYKATPDTNLYATFSKGFKSGVYNTTSFQTTPVDPEKVTAYEVGIKSRPAPNVTLNGAVFFNNYKDLQVPTLVQVGLSFQQFLNNAASVHIWGGEVSTVWNPVDALRLSASAAYTHARYKRFPNAVINVPDNTTGGFRTLPPTDVSGNHMIRTPDLAANITAQYVFDTAAGDIELAGTAAYSSKIYFEEGNRVVQPSFETINASIAWRPQRFEGVELRAWGRNLTNKKVLNSYGGGTLHETVTYLPPRMVGVEASYRF